MVRAIRRCIMEPMPRDPPFNRPATYDDLAEVPDIMVAEIVDDELHASPRPAPRHANVTSALGSAVFAPYHHGRGGPGGWLILFEPELHLGRNVLVPDLAGWRRTRMPRLPAEAYFSVAPDWVCEVLSPSTASLDRVKKLAIYPREQVGCRVARRSGRSDAGDPSPRGGPLDDSRHARGERSRSRRTVRRHRPGNGVALGRRGRGVGNVVVPGPGPEVLPMAVSDAGCSI